MKIYTKIPIFALIILGFTSCKKFLVENVQGAYSTSIFYKTAAQAQEAVTAAYQPTSFSNSNNRLWVFGDVASDDADKGGDPGDQADIGLIDNYNVYATNGNLAAMWSVLYDGVNRANLVIKYVPAIDMDTTLRSRYISEAKFLRAYYYFQLVNIFGPVPLILEPKNADELQITQSTVADIYSQGIEADLKYAAQHLPKTYASADIGRVTKGAALALLTKAYLYQQKWQLVVDTAPQIVLAGGYKLMNVYQFNFNQKYKGNQESIFEIQHLTNQTPFMGNTLNQWFAPRFEGGYFFDVPTANFVKEFETTADGVVDPRLDYTVGRAGQKWTDGGDFDAAWSPSGYLQKKSRQPTSEIPVNNIGNGNLNFIAIRYADVLLWQAEALNELGNSAQALPFLNAVRQRARESYRYDLSLTKAGSIPSKLLPDVITTDQNALRTKIHHERRVELGFEFSRYFDLMRWGATEAKAALGTNSTFDYTKNRYFPIPQSERDTNHALK